MAKRFSIVNVEDNKIVTYGFIEPEELAELPPFVEIISEISSYVDVEVEIEHCTLLDNSEKDEDISFEELEDMMEDFDSLVDKELIFCEDTITFEMPGFKEEYIEEEIY